MPTIPTQIRIEENLKKQSNELFSQLGLDMSSAVNVFLKQCVLRGGLPFSVELPDYNHPPYPAEGTIGRGEVLDENGFTPEESQELQRRFADVRRGRVLQHDLLEV